MRQILELSQSLANEDQLPVALLTPSGLVQGFLVTEQTYSRSADNSLGKSARGNPYTKGGGNEAYERLRETFKERNLGEDPSGESIPLVKAVVTLSLATLKIPALRLNPNQVVGWWIVEHEGKNAKFQGGGVGVGAIV